MVNDRNLQWESDSIEAAGWYATVHSWDSQEGMFCDSHYWDGFSWDWDGPIFMWAGPFPSKELAIEWANAHDPEA